MDVDFVSPHTESNEENDNDGVEDLRWRPGIRHVQAVYTALSCVVMGAMRGAVSVAVFATNWCEKSEDDGNKCEWQIKGLLDGSFLLGHALGAIPFRLLVLRTRDGKLPFTCALLACTAFTAAMPAILDKGSWTGACGALLGLGLAQSVMTPASNMLLQRWLPSSERRYLAHFVYFGVEFGTVVSLASWAGTLNTWLGPRLAWLSAAILSGAYTAMWQLTAAAPAHHRAVSDKERDYIQAFTNKRKEAKFSPKNQNLMTPAVTESMALAALLLLSVSPRVNGFAWPAISTNKAPPSSLCGMTWIGFTAARAANASIFAALLFLAPRYLRHTGFSFNQSTSLSCVPIIAQWISYTATTPLVAVLQDKLRDYYATWNQRCSSIVFGVGSIVGITAFVALSCSAQTSALGLTMLTGVGASLGIQHAACLASHQEVWGSGADAMLARSNTMAGLFAALLTLGAEFLLGYDHDDSGWSYVWISVAVVQVLGCLIYLLLNNTSSTQHWTAITSELTLIPESDLAERDRMEEQISLTDTALLRN